MDVRMVQMNIHGLYHPVHQMIAPDIMARKIRARTMGRVLIPERTAVVSLITWNQSGRKYTRKTMTPPTHRDYKALQEMLRFSIGRGGMVAFSCCQP